MTAAGLRITAVSRAHIVVVAVERTRPDTATVRARVARRADASIVAGAAVALRTPPCCVAGWGALLALVRRIRRAGRIANTGDQAEPRLKGVLACATGGGAGICRARETVIARCGSAARGINAIAAPTVCTCAAGLSQRQLVAALIVDLSASHPGNAIGVGPTGLEAGDLQLAVADIRRTRRRRGWRRAVPLSVAAVTGAVAIGGGRPRATGACAAGVTTARV